jgi:hypothetical protein
MLVMVLAAILFAVFSPTSGMAMDKTDRPFPAGSVAYLQEKDPRGPWSIHLIRIDRHNTNYFFTTTLGGERKIGRATLTDQLVSLPMGKGKPVAAINGDFFLINLHHFGDPRGLQVIDGELVSAPAGHSSLWFDAKGAPCATNVYSDFRIHFPDGSSTPFDLNQNRWHDESILFTAANGSSTRTWGGREIELAPLPEQSCLPLRIGQEMKVKVARVREGGNTRLGPDSLVFSLGSRLASKVPVLKPGDELVISTATRPNLTGVTTAIGGGPKLVTDGKAWKWKNPEQARHPRSAIGWNRDFIFLVVVEGEQKTSVGMSFPELATYLVGLGCEEALNFDGGGSSALWYQGETVIQASQNDERLVANALVLCERPVIKGLGGKERESLSPQGVKKR